MKVTTIEYSRRIPLEQYGYEEAKGVATLDEGEDHVKALFNLKKDLNNALSGNLPRLPEIDKVPTENPANIIASDAPEESSTKKTRKPRAKKEDAAPVVEEPTETFEHLSEADIEANQEAEVREAAEEKKIEETPAKETKKLRVKGTPYDREATLHKKLFGEVMTREFPNWKQTPLKAKDVSIDLAGEEFLDAEGQILPSFVEKIKERYS